MSAGEVLFTEGEPGACLFIVTEGEIVVEARGRELARLGPGAFVGAGRAGHRLAALGERARRCARGAARRSIATWCAISSRSIRRCSACCCASSAIAPSIASRTRPSCSARSRSRSGAALSARFELVEVDPHAADRAGDARRRPLCRARGRAECVARRRARGGRGARPRRGVRRDVAARGTPARLRMRAAKSRARAAHARAHVPGGDHDAPPGARVRGRARGAACAASRGGGRLRRSAPRSRSGGAKGIDCAGARATRRITRVGSGRGVAIPEGMHATQIYRALVVGLLGAIALEIAVLPGELRPRQAPEPAPRASRCCMSSATRSDRRSDDRGDDRAAGDRGRGGRRGWACPRGDRRAGLLERDAALGAVGDHGAAQLRAAGELAE